MPMERAHKAQADPGVSVIVVTHNNQWLLSECLRSIERGVVGHSYEVIVVDSGSTDRTVDRARDDPRRPRVIALPENVGFAAANNAGIAHSRGRIIVLVNSDAFPDHGSIDRLIETMEALPRAGIVGGVLRDPTGKLQPSAGRFPSLLGNLWTALLLHRVPVLGRLDIGVNSHPVQYRTRRQVDWVTAAYCAARRQAAPLPELMFMYGEDVEWADACAERGLEVWLEPTARAVHIGRASVDQSQAPGFAQRRRVQFELAWFRRRGHAVKAAARVVLVVHALSRLALYGMLAALGRRHIALLTENIVLLKEAIAPNRADK